MSKPRIYLDNNATTQPLPEVVDVVHVAMQKIWGNPSSIHRVGQEARHQVDLAREEIAKLIHTTPAEITFTSGGTEAANLAIQTACAANPTRRLIITSHVEHAAVSEMIDALVEKNMEVIRIDNDLNGVISVSHLQTVLEQRASEIALVSIMWCNNETGVVEPMKAISALCKEHDVLLHSDATQWVGKMPVDVSVTSGVPVDMMSFAAHKFHGPKGIGALFVRKGINIAPLITGGPQERGRRGGTENVPAILGFGVAARLAKEWITSTNIAQMEKLRDSFETTLMQRLPQVHINSKGAVRAWTTSSISVPSVKGELLLLMLSERGICASSGAACSSGAFKDSKVMQAIGTPDDGEWGTLRFSFSRETTLTELEETIHALSAVLATIETIAKTKIAP